MGERSLFFRNWQDVALFPAKRDEGRAFRLKIGKDSLLALVTIRDIRKSPTRSGGYEGQVASVTCSTPRAARSAASPPPDAIAADPTAVAAQTEAARQTILTAAGIPPLGTTSEAARQQLQPLWPVMASSDFVDWGNGRRVGYFWKDGAVQQDEAHDPARASGSIDSITRLDGAEGWRAYQCQRDRPALLNRRRRGRHARLGRGPRLLHPRGARPLAPC